MESSLNPTESGKPLSSPATFKTYLEDLEKRLVEHYAQVAINHIEHSRYMVKIFQKDFPDLGKKVAKRLGELNVHG
jgi:hypothetical protein